MSDQLESRHYFKSGDTVRHIDGRSGTVTRSYALYAIIEWPDGSRAEFDQFDPDVEVAVRAVSE